MPKTPQPKQLRRTRAAISVRLWLLVMCCATGFALLAARVVDLQAFRYTTYRLQADANRYATRFVPKERGVFLDRYGNTLVYNVPKYFYADSRGMQTEAGFLAEHEVLPMLATQSAAISYQLDRRYLYPESTAHVLGYTGAPSAEDLLQNRSVRPTDVVGKTGLERMLDEKLQGTATELLYEVNALGEPLRVLQETPGKAGITVSTTIDPYISEVAYQALGDQRGVVIVTDVQTGEVLSLVSRPAFSATTMSEHALELEAEQKRKQVIQSYFTHPQKLFFNRAVSGTYPPGSVFKLVTALAGLEKGSIDSTTSVTDEGTLKVGEYEYANWYFTQYGRTEGAISLTRALARSNDIYFYKVAEWIGPTALAEFARLFGFGSPTGIELAAEAAGTVPDPIWKEQTVGEQWFLGNTYHFGIGQGDVLVTPLQIAQLTQAVGNGGKLCTPHVLSQDLTGDERLRCSELGVTEDHLELVLEGMIAACSSGGTAFPFFTYNQGRVDASLSASEQFARGAVACKTGTAEFGGADERGYRATHGWFVATVQLTDEITQEATSSATATDSAAIDFSPEAPEQKTWSQLRDSWLTHATEFPRKIGITVLVESDEAQPYKEGSRDAAPVAKAIIDWLHGESVGPPQGRDQVTEGE